MPIAGIVAPEYVTLPEFLLGFTGLAAMQFIFAVIAMLERDRAKREILDKLEGKK